MQIQIPTAALKSAFAAAVTAALSSEQQLGADAQSQIQALVDDLYPLVMAETQAAITAADKTIPDGYLSILTGVVEASIAKLGLQALATQRGVIASALQAGVSILATVLKTAVIAAV